jgi:hypothetical protein
MKMSSSPCQTASKFSGPARQLPNGFAIATILAGLCLLACTRPTAAEIVYTPANVTIAKGQSYNLSLNNDGVTDFTISSWRMSSTCGLLEESTSWGITEAPASSNDAEGKPPAELIKGDHIGTRQAFYSSPGQLATYTLGCGGLGGGPGGNWAANGDDGYLGLRLEIDGETYYGWAELSIVGVYGKDGSFTATLTGYAYETVPGMPINAGQTADGSSTLRPGPGNRDDSGLGAAVTNPVQAISLGTLALGTQEVPLLRRKESAVAAPENS